MKAKKSFIAVLLCLVMLVTFAACGKTDKGTDPSDESDKGTVQSTDGKTQTLEELGLSIKKLSEANKIENLLKKYDTITVRYESSDGSEYIKQVFKFDDAIALVQQSKSSNGETSVSGQIKGFDFSVEKDRVKAYRDVEKLNSTPEFKQKDLLTESFDGKELVVQETADEYYKLKSVAEEKEKSGTRLFYFDKTTLALTKITFENSVGYTENTVITYNGELEDFSRKITDSFEGELKTVKIKGELSDGNSVTNISTELKLPDAWEYVPSGEGRIDYHMNEGFTEDYAYPGHGEDYTLYVSNVFDDEDTGKK